MQGKYIYSKNKIERKRIIEHEVFAMIKLKNDISFSLHIH